MFLREVECAIHLKKVQFQALSGQQGRGNFLRTLWPSQPATWETRAVGVALRSVNRKAWKRPWAFLHFCWLGGAFYPLLPLLPHISLLHLPLFPLPLLY